MIRPRSEWGSGDLPAPYAEGDVIDVPEGARCLQPDDDGEARVRTGPGRYVVTFATSIGGGDEWYFRIDPERPKRRQRRSSDRLHVVYADRSDAAADINYLEGTRLVRTVDPEGLSRRQLLLAANWQPPCYDRCPECGHVLPERP